MLHLCFEITLPPKIIVIEAHDFSFYHPADVFIPQKTENEINDAC